MPSEIQQLQGDSELWPNGRLRAIPASQRVFTARLGLVKRTVGAGTTPLCRVGLGRGQSTGTRSPLEASHGALEATLGLGR